MDPNIKQVFIDVHKWVRYAALRARGGGGDAVRACVRACVRAYLLRQRCARCWRRAMTPPRGPSRRANEYVATPEEVTMLKESTVRIRRYALGG